jgi:hypothetical protein
MTSGDHKEWVYTYLTQVAADLQTKIDSMPAGEKKDAAQAKLNDMKAKVADAKVNADAALSLVVDLTPDHGDAQIRKDNKAALDSATTKLQAAHTDYVAARADVDAINALLNGSASTGNGHTIMKVSPSNGSSHPIVPVHPILPHVDGNVIMKVNPGTPTVSTHANFSAAVK